MGVAADQLDQLIGAALTVRFEPLMPAGRLILRRVSRRDLLPGLLCAADDYERVPCVGIGLGVGAGLLVTGVLLTAVKGVDGESGHLRARLGGCKTRWSQVGLRSGLACLSAGQPL
jgi:hypothetical protein